MPKKSVKKIRPSSPDRLLVDTVRIGLDLIAVQAAEAIRLGRIGMRVLADLEVGGVPKVQDRWTIMDAPVFQRAKRLAESRPWPGVVEFELTGWTIFHGAEVQARVKPFLDTPTGMERFFGSDFPAELERKMGNLLGAARAIIGKEIVQKERAAKKYCLDPDMPIPLCSVCGEILFAVPATKLSERYWWCSGCLRRWTADGTPKFHVPMPDEDKPEPKPEPPKPIVGKVLAEWIRVRIQDALAATLEWGGFGDRTVSWEEPAEDPFCYHVRAPSIGAEFSVFWTPGKVDAGWVQVCLKGHAEHAFRIYPGQPAYDLATTRAIAEMIYISVGDHEKRKREEKA